MGKQKLFKQRRRVLRALCASAHSRRSLRALHSSDSSSSSSDESPARSVQSTAVPAPAAQLLPSLEKDEPRKSFGIKVQNLPVRSTGKGTGEGEMGGKKRSREWGRDGLNNLDRVSLTVGFLSLLV